ncbi:hypothetical protein HUG17_0350 [Dermatophagoides farinae]|uniref:Uncharacterized protein n=1 Tax=Dermatophagoides farinae TaxID=6954 RepID=A0A9D4SK35_DERFA|nr:hypothetical protein HUG17_0350 [Dermatophagoides farinae]
MVMMPNITNLLVDIWSLTWPELDWIVGATYSDRRRTIGKLNLEPRIEFGHCLVTWTANIGSISNDHGSPANNWEIESRTTDRIWTLSCNMDREYWIYFK